jgi:hypothetical protein
MGSIKGTFFLNTVKALSRHGDAAEGVLPRELRHYLEERILTSSWYPEEDHRDLLRALIRLAPPSGGDPWEHYGQLSAERDMGSIYKVLLRDGDPDATFVRLGSVWSQAHDTGHLESSLPDPGRGLLELRDYDLVDRDFCRLNTSFFATVLRLAGARDVTLRHTACRSLGADACRWEASWSQ